MNRGQKTGTLYAYVCSILLHQEIQQHNQGKKSRESREFTPDNTLVDNNELYNKKTNTKRGRLSFAGKQEIREASY